MSNTILLWQLHTTSKLDNNTAGILHSTSSIASIIHRQTWWKSILTYYSDLFQTVFALNHRCDIFIMKKFHIKCREDLSKKIYIKIWKRCAILKALLFTVCIFDMNLKINTNNNMCNTINIKHISDQDIYISRMFEITCVFHSDSHVIIYTVVCYIQKTSEIHLYSTW